MADNWIKDLVDGLPETSIATYLINGTSDSLYTEKNSETIVAPLYIGENLEEVNSAYRPGRWITKEIGDNGIGIPFGLEDSDTQVYFPSLLELTEADIKGRGRGGSQGGSGGHTETAGNNLSFPAIWYHGAGDDPLGLDSEGEYEDSLSLTVPFLTEADENGYYYFAQKTEGNKWQAGNIQAPELVEVDYVDIGDAMESSPVRLERFLRLELALYDDLLTDGDYTPDSMRAYTMTQLSEQTGRNEIQGTRADSNSVVVDNDSSQIDELLGTTTYESSFATVYAPMMELTIQKLDSEVDELTGLWNGTQWVGEGISNEDYAANTQFGSELNVAGKVINGVSDKPFRFTEEGLYRITFSLPDDISIVFTEDTQVGNYSAEGFTELTEGRTTTVVPDGQLGIDDNDTHNGLLYMDIIVPSVMGGGEEELFVATDDTFI